MKEIFTQEQLFKMTTNVEESIKNGAYRKLVERYNWLIINIAEDKYKSLIEQKGEEKTKELITLVELICAGTKGLMKAIEKSEGEYYDNFNKEAIEIITNEMNEKVKDKERGISYDSMKKIINYVATNKYKEPVKEETEPLNIGNVVICVFAFLFFLVAIVAIIIGVSNTPV